MRFKFTYLFVALLFQFSFYGQKLDTDSLLVVTNKLINIDKNYSKAIELGHIGIKNAPNYLDFHIALGRAFKFTNEIDSARYYFNHVIAKNTKYKEAFSYLTQLEIEAKNFNNASLVIDNAIATHPEEKDFYMLKLRVVSMENNDKKTLHYLNVLTNKYPTDKNIKDQIFDLKLKSNSDRIGINYNLTTFDRAGVGPWNLTSFQYVRQRKRITLIGRINYTNRASFGQTISSGTLYEAESYVRLTKKTYSFINVGLGNDNVFPKLRMNYSLYSSLGKRWENEIGIRYNKTINNENYSAVLGFGKYIGAGWLNLRSYIQLGQNKPYPSLSTTYRYYFNSRFDYFSLNAGFGTSPDERETIAQFEQRISLNSFRIGAGYNKVFLKKLLFGVQMGFNRQEYISNSYQNELNTSLQLQYQF
jgi:YaiO family outer membrane protein